jgi:hypothetical protein
MRGVDRRRDEPRVKAAVGEYAERERVGFEGDIRLWLDRAAYVRQVWEAARAANGPLEVEFAPEGAVTNALGTEHGEGGRLGPSLGGPAPERRAREARHDPRGRGADEAIAHAEDDRVPEHLDPREVVRDPHHLAGPEAAGRGVGHAEAVVA